MISEKLKKAILKALDLADYPMSEETTADQIPGWDSLNHVRVILAVEKEYSVRLKGMEILKLQNIGDLQKLVDSKLDPG